MRQTKAQIAAYGAVRVVASMTAVPKRLSNTIYLVEREGKQRWAVLKCPCGCGVRVDVNLMRSRWPNWRVMRHRDRSMTLMPSLWLSQDACGSHFWIYRNRVVWVSERKVRARRGWPAFRPQVEGS